MCIRDRITVAHIRVLAVAFGGVNGVQLLDTGLYFIMELSICLLYTSDAADERSSVDLGGRRIIKKKTTRAQDIGQLSRRKEQ